MSYSNRRRRFFVGPFILLALLGVTYVVYWLWNHVLVAVVTPVKPVTYWQAMGLLILFRLLMGGFKFSPPTNRFTGGRAPWGDRWQQMTDEERSKFKEEWRQRWRKRN